MPKKDTKGKVPGDFDRPRSNAKIFIPKNYLVPPIVPPLFLWGRV